MRGRFLDTCTKIAFDAEVNIGQDPGGVAFNYVVALERLVSAKGDRGDLKGRTLSGLPCWLAVTTLSA
ncbi:hypothetical protein [Amycolatopsis palatopharyngis]|uniref:hypothetical protein n=1 Tax=Amycolatopsis palatopharyngis TaxID=187982 RepID=UPI000E28749D|nr:hypothetical protein [Amycolatopsis palatopharyngis]